MVEKLAQIGENLKKICEKYQETKNINLYIPHYRDKNDNRNKENELCIQLNISNKLFNKIYLLSECDQDLNFIEKSERITIIKSPRSKFIDIFTYSNTQTNNDTINILINTDIVIGESFDNIQLDSKQMICLSRYDVMSDCSYKVNVGGGSHDCWIWSGKIVETVGNFYMGKMLCDGVLANQLASAGYTLKNPMLDMKVYHVHLTNVRNYNWVNAIRGRRSGINFSKNDGQFDGKDLYCDGCN